MRELGRITLTLAKLKLEVALMYQTDPPRPPQEVLPWDFGKVPTRRQQVYGCVGTMRVINGNQHLQSKLNKNANGLRNWRNICVIRGLIRITCFEREAILV